MALSGNLTGSGTLNLNVQSNTASDYFNGNASGFTGTVNFLGSGVMRRRANGGAFGGFQNALTMMNSPVDWHFTTTPAATPFTLARCPARMPARFCYLE